MKDKRKYNSILERVIFITIIVLLVSVPFVYWKSFFNGFDLIKFSAIKVIGGFFIIEVSIWLIIESRHQNVKLRLEKTLDPFIFFFLLSALVSVVFSQNPFVSFTGNYETQIGLLIYLYLFVFYFLLPLVINTENKIRITFLFLETSAVIIAFFSIVQYFGMNPFTLRPSGFERPVTPIGYPVFTAGFMVLLFPFSVLNISQKKSLYVKILMPLILAAGIISTQTRATYAALAAEVIVILLLFPFTYRTNKNSAKKYLKYSMGFLLLLIFLVFTAVVFFPDNIFIKRFISIGTITKLPRWFLWRDSFEMFKHYPFKGTGIAMFSRVFEFFSSYELRYANIEGVFINAHNNFINTFCTMGLLGGIAYLILLLQVLHLSGKMVFTSSKDVKTRIFFLASFCFISGYMVYGLADFDDVTILFLLFILLALFKIKFSKSTNNKYIFEKLTLKRPAALAVSIILILFSVYYMYPVYNIILAEKNFSEGLLKYNEGDFKGFLQDMDRAVELNPNESFYRYNFASHINVYSSGLSGKSERLKEQLLEKAKGEVKAAEKNYRSKLECVAMESLIELQLGNVDEGFRLKDELFKADTTRFSYRINLAVYYLNLGKDSSALREVNSVLKWDFKNVNALITKTLYYLRQGNNNEAKKICNYILTINPSNRFARETLKELNEKN